MPDFIINGPLAYVTREDSRLATKLVKLLLIHNRYRMSAATAARLPGVALAIETLRSRMLASDAQHVQRRAA